MGRSESGSSCHRPKSRHKEDRKSRSLSSSSIGRQSPNPQKKPERTSEKKTKRRRSPSTSSSSSSSSISSNEKEAKKKKKKHREAKKKMKHKKKKEKREKKLQKKFAEKAVREEVAASVQTPVSVGPQKFLQTWQSEESKEHGPVMTDEQMARLHTKRPMTKEEYEARQSVIRRVYDSETGRTRLIRGDGEILEEIVSQERHKEINKQATKGDGDAFQKRLGISR
ncbi:ADP-ribosylation factor-like protein 6-interacting protein 4 isoform X2 [Xyrauchen texanus]|uniref:ADP-ribosylation factor-like protein 6-interacting protein 4 isoform X2 n=1 Tax=Xyrauchen texanus TaxID=154827 RepID=UPI002241A4D4|nr:ADP-ribosylation factor-like protein 6-interacting protein 4 isoform X2 [Xyrauchen texanus]